MSFSSSSSFRGGGSHKFGYASSSPFDEALSKPLMDLQEKTAPSSSSSSSLMSKRDSVVPSTAMAVFTNKWTSGGGDDRISKQGYAPPKVTKKSNINNKYDDDDEEQQWTEMPIRSKEEMDASWIIPLDQQRRRRHERQRQQQHQLMQQQEQQEQEPLGRFMDHALLQERHVESQTISNQMRQILEINQDLSYLVAQQQESIDIIEENALETHDNAERGKSYLEQANRVMQRTMKGEGFMRVFFWVLAVGGLMIALVLLLEAL